MANIFMDYMNKKTPSVDFAVPDNYSGRCKLICDGRSAVFPNINEAERAAKVAANPTFGGFVNIKIEPTSDNITHDSAYHWIAGC